MKFLSSLWVWSPVFVWAAGIFYLSGIPSLDTGWGLWDFLLRKTAHVVEFGVLALLVLRAFRRTWPSLSQRSLFLWGILLPVLYAVSDEYHQSFVPGRGPSPVDVIIDSVGVLLAAGIYRYRVFRTKRPF